MTTKRIYVFEIMYVVALVYVFGIFMTLRNIRQQCVSLEESWLGNTSKEGKIGQDIIISPVEDEEAISFLVKRDPFDGFSVVA